MRLTFSGALDPSGFGVAAELLRLGGTLTWGYQEFHISLSNDTAKRVMAGLQAEADADYEDALHESEQMINALTSDLEDWESFEPPGFDEMRELMTLQFQVLWVPTDDPTVAYVEPDDPEPAYRLAEDPEEPAHELPPPRLEVFRPRLPENLEVHLARFKAVRCQVEAGSGSVAAAVRLVATHENVGAATVEASYYRTVNAAKSEYARLVDIGAPDPLGAVAALLDQKRERAKILIGF